MKRRDGDQRFLYRNVVLMALSAVALPVMLILILVALTWRNAQYLEPMNLSNAETANRHSVVTLPPTENDTEETKGSNGTEDDWPYREPQPARSPNDSVPLVPGGAPDFQAVEELVQKNHRELQMAMAVAMILPFMILLLWKQFARRVLHPLKSLMQGMELLAHRDYRPVDADRIDPFLRPVFAKYNRMVVRMEELEKAHVKREQALRQELEQKASAIVQQQAMLGRVDRVSLLGAVAARLAHRMRNPLTGVLVTLTNLSEETTSSSERLRLKLSIEALMRSFAELTALLQDAAQEPEQSRELALAEIVDELFLLIRHQTNKPTLRLSNQIDRGFQCRLPEMAVRHAMLKLLQNAVKVQEDEDQAQIKVCARHQPGEVEIAVEDNGPGFSAELVTKQQMPLSGKGTGLAIVWRFCDFRGGRLMLNNLPAGGARASMILPQEEHHV